MKSKQGDANQESMFNRKMRFLIFPLRLCFKNGIPADSMAFDLADKMMKSCVAERGARHGEQPESF
jgi:hypothetical protein